MQRHLGRTCLLYPMPATIVGAMVDGRPNFLAIAHVGILNNAAPQYLTVSLKKFRHTSRGIRESGAFSICLPGKSMAVATDYVGIVSGAKVDKSRVFDVFYGELGNAPMIRECPVNMELKLHQVIDLPAHEVFVGELAGSYAEESCLKEGKVDLEKARPLLFDYSSGWYFSVGEPVAPCWRAGRDYPAQRTEHEGV
ncbi:flavin reductase domain protein FMN-binding [Solidesulfovibrio fructosivorans JJ]]|uniref:Flavin reductase domain protein FMN-binding n=1 Tax=Solidesulfovibrio fructosivorans JJ] TaxID=596151 RepID=E1K0D4_SOLFR|nr:flavin reductase family protein [Solidesulfovibrio fructosivorans]EFL49965.1 flavin reductase domain protein FMN-binding [Solidesulfovibrio fructosivorans JJ]]